LVNLQCSFSTLAWHKKLLNLSVRATIEGYIELPKGFKKLGFDKEFDTVQHRTYTLVKDGFLNMTTLPVSMSKKTFTTLKKKGLLGNYTYEKDHIYDLPLNTVPVMNRAIAEGNTSATDLCKSIFFELEMQGRMKVLKAKLKELEEAESMVDDVFADYTDKQIEFLDKCGITKHGFSPKTEKEDPVDYYFAKEFEIKVKKFSSLPSVKDVNKKLASGKTLTGVQELVNEGIEAAKRCESNSNKKTIANLKKAMEHTKGCLLDTRFDIQRAKFSTILGKQWYDEFDSRDNCSLNVDGKDFVFEVKDTKISI